MEGGVGKRKTGQTLTSISEKLATCSLAASGNMEPNQGYRERERVGENADGKGDGQGWTGAFAICIVCKMLQVNYAELQQQWQKVKVKRTTKWNLHWLSLLSPLSTFYFPPQALFVMSL